MNLGDGIEAQIRATREILTFSSYYIKIVKSKYLDGEEETCDYTEISLD